MRDLVAAQAALLRARRRLKHEPIGSLTERRQRHAAPARGDRARAEQLAAAVNGAARFGLFRPFCLVRAVALEDLLLREGITGSDIRIGVRRRDGVFAAHAWVRWGDVLLGDDVAHVATFTEVDDIRVLQGA
jgi:hypothetical protein